jgi:predicted transcriptional regulator
VNQPPLSWKTTAKGTSFAGIGSLEGDILAVIWEGPSTGVSVRYVYEELLTRRRIAYTTVMTVMVNLTKKGLLARDRSQITHIYRAAIPGDEVAGQVLDSVIRVLYRGYVHAAATHLLRLEAELTEAQLENVRRYAGKLVAR